MADDCEPRRPLTMLRPSASSDSQPLSSEQTTRSASSSTESESVLSGVDRMRPPLWRERLSRWTGEERAELEPALRRAGRLASQRHQPGRRSPWATECNTGRTSEEATDR